MSQTFGTRYQTLLPMVEQSLCQPRYALPARGGLCLNVILAKGLQIVASRHTTRLGWLRRIARPDLWRFASRLWGFLRNLRNQFDKMIAYCTVQRASRCDWMRAVPFPGLATACFWRVRHTLPVERVQVPECGEGVKRANPDDGQQIVPIGS